VHQGDRDGVKMLHQNEGHTSVGGNALENPRVGLTAPSAPIMSLPSARSSENYVCQMIADERMLGIVPSCAWQLVVEEMVEPQRDISCSLGQE
jgi:hypothetical protein